MAKPNMKFIATSKSKLDTIPKKAGQLIFVIDDRAIYLDIDKQQRTTYQSIISVINEETRQEIVSPIEGFYYVRQENTLWSYFNATWAQIMGQNSSLIFADNGLPEEGIKNSLYVEGTTLYRWNDLENRYEIINSKIDWEII